MIEPRSAFVDADNVRLHYLEWDPVVLRRTQQPGTLAAENDPSDDVPIILLHGLGATADTWRLTAAHLCQQNLVLAFDLRGHGRSDKPEDGYDMATVVEDIISGMARLGFGQVAVVGHGWGARVALVLAARHAALLSHLILVDCPHIEPRYWPGMTRERFLRERDMVETYATRDAYLEVFKRDMGSFWSPEIERIALTYVRELPDGHVEELLRPEHQYQIREALWDDNALSYYGKVGCPVLLVPAADKPRPGEEPPERLEQAVEFAAVKGQVVAQVTRAIQRCSVLWMPNTVHDIQLQHPEVLARAISNFLEETW